MRLRTSSQKQLIAWPKMYYTRLVHNRCFLRVLQWKYHTRTWMTWRSLVRFDKSKAGRSARRKSK
jgi:hypothetical protein